ncbi:MAG: adenylate/guanylate cyclase domain-containing protein [Thermoleophilia bacterium]|nr:adenylate/guanylate cyclase domain-containing protein [Thermoleophilia bacterium]
MPEKPEYLPELPDHPELREIALVIEDAGMMGEILDASFRCVFLSTETARMIGASASEAKYLVGKSLIARSGGKFTRLVQATEESGIAWFQHNAPIMRRYLEPDDPGFEDVFDYAAPFATEIDPVEPAPRAWHDTVSFPSDLGFRRTMLGDQNQVQMRISDDAGSFLGVLYLYRSTVPESLLQRLGRGDPGLFERMDRVSEPGRRPAGILFADLEASGVLSRRLSSRGYFDLIRGLTDLIDSSVISSSGIVGKHAGDGGSALFLTEDFDGSESATARATIEAARAIRDGARELGPENVEVKVNVGTHWGATLMVGQVATGGRLEVTALGDQMNEGARIEAAAKEGPILASKDLIERLDSGDAQATSLDPDTIAYTPISEIGGAGDKAIRDAGAISVTSI